MKTLCTLFASLLIAGSAFAQTNRVVPILWEPLAFPLEAPIFKVYVGTNSGAYQTVHVVTNVDFAVTSFSNAFPAGIYFLMVTVLDPNGIEGLPSNEIKFTVHPPLRIRVTLQSKQDLSDPER
jgi:hypothetical protein